MSEAIDDKKCPFCGELVAARAARCPSCKKALPEEDDVEEAIAVEPARRPPRPARNEDDDDEDDRPRRRSSYRKEPTTEATDFLVPTNVSGWAIASCYLGLFGCLLPVAGLIFAVPAVIFGIIAIRKPRREGNYGAVTSNVRAIIGLVLSTLSILLWGGVLVLFALGKIK